MLRYLRERAHLYQAVVVSGGEPTLHHDLPDFLAELKGAGLLTGIETNGSNPEMLMDIVKGAIIDFVGMDVKTKPDFQAYRKAAGIPDKTLFDKVLQSVDLLLRASSSSSLQIEFRTTVLRSLHCRKTILDIAAFLKGAETYVLQQCVWNVPTIGNLKEQMCYPSEFFHRLHSEIKNNFAVCEIRNI